MEDKDLKDKTKELIGKDTIHNEIDVFWACIAYIIFFLPLLSKHRHNDFVEYHMRQGFALFIIFIIAAVISEISGSFIIKLILYLAVFFLWCWGEMYVLIGRKENLPIIGALAEKIKKSEII